MSKISELSDGGALQSTDYLIAVRSGGNVKVQPNGTVTGTTGSFSGNVTFADNAKAIFGAGSDLQIYHDGSNSYIKDAGTGNLNIQTDGVGVVIEHTDGTNLAVFNAGDGTASLYHSGNLKLTTTATGIDVTGTVTATTALEVSSGVPYIDWTDTATTDEDTRAITFNGDFYIGTINDAKTTTKKRFLIDHSTGDISFYEDTGTTPKFFWDASAEALGLGTTSPAADLSIFSATGSSQGITLQASGWSYLGRIGMNGASGGEQYWTANYSFSSSAVDSSSYYSTYIQNSAAQGIVAFGTSSAINTAPTERMRIDSSGNVEIKSGGKLQANRADNARNIQLFTDNDFGTIQTSNDPIKIASQAYTRFDVSGAEAMRIDSSGNLLVGKSTADVGATAGFEWYDTADVLTLTRSAGNALSVNRLTSDGSIVTFRKDGTTVGSIGNDTTALTIGSGSTGVKFGSAAVWATTGGATNANGTKDLGASTVRWKDLYLSGGVYLGGTGAANLLDDYEEGTWTPTVTTGGWTLSLAKASYVKVGNMVTAAAYVNVSGTGNTNDLVLGGLPFSAETNSFHPSAADVQKSLYSGVYARAGSGTDVEFFRSSESVSVNRVAVNGNEIGAGYIIYSVTYFVA